MGFNGYQDKVARLAKFLRLAPFCNTLRPHKMSWGVKSTCFKAPGVSLGGSGVSIGGVRILRIGFLRWLPCSLVEPQFRWHWNVWFSGCCLGPGRLRVGHLTSTSENRLPRSGFSVAARGNVPNEELGRSSSRCLGGFTLQKKRDKHIPANGKLGKSLDSKLPA